MAKQKKQKTHLIITSSGGGGLIQAAIAKEQELKAEDPGAKIIVKDVMQEWVWRGIGLFGVFAYNWTQKRGRIFLQTLLVNCQRAAEVLFLPRIYFKLRKILQEESVDRIIDTQPLGTKVMIKALRHFHKKSGKKIILEKIAVDLPTPSCQHFFRGVKSLSAQDREYLSFITIEPLLEKGESVADFWKKHCDLKPSEVVYEKYPIRQSFKKLMKQPPSFLVKELTIRSESKKESTHQRKIFTRGSIAFSVAPSGHVFSIAPNDWVMVILLGSNPAENAAFRYIAETIRVAQKRDLSKKIHLFVFCGKYEGTLFQEVCHFLEGVKEYPKNVSVIPMSFQTDEAIAPLFHRSNISITKSGGHTAMELLAVSRNHMWIHSEAKKEGGSSWTTQELLGGIASWEAGNALYLKEKAKAEIVTPERFAPLFEKLLAEAP